MPYVRIIDRYTYTCIFVARIIGKRKGIRHFINTINYAKSNTETFSKSCSACT